jgi:nucleoside phosphorylase
LKILVTFALEFEFQPWRQLRQFQPATLLLQPVYSARVGMVEVCVAITGMGPANASRVAEAACAGAPDICISSGLAGALVEHLTIGEVFAATQVVNRSGAAPLASDLRLLDAAISRGARRVERLVSSENAVFTAVEKQELSEVGQAVEMESYAVLRAASRHRIPGVVVRSISDLAEEGLPYDFTDSVDAAGQVRAARVLAQVVKQPHKLPALLRMSRASRRAAQRLAEFLDGYVAGMVQERTPLRAMHEVAIG